MAVYGLKAALRFLLLSGITFSCKGAKVQLFKDVNFQGEMLELNSSTSCTTLPTNFHSLNGSIKTTNCTVVYTKNNCLKNGIYWVYEGIDGDGYVIRSEETHLNRLNHKYIPTKGSAKDFSVNSIKDCDENVTKHSHDIDYYEEQFFEGKMVQLQDICSCTNLPKSSFKAGSWRSANTYGSCFRIFHTMDCVGEPYYIATVIYIPTFTNDFLSVEPCDVSRHCRRYSAMNLTFEPQSILSKAPYSIEQVTIFTNNRSTTVEKYYDAVMEANETTQFEVAKELIQFESINFLASNSADLQSIFPVNSSTTLKSAIETAFEGLWSNWNETIVKGLRTKRAFPANEKLLLTPCTTYELKQLVETTQVEITYRVQFRVSGSGMRVKAETIRSDMEYFKHLNSTEEYSILAETTLKLKLSYVTKTWITVTKAPIVECGHNLIRLEATVINLQPVPSVRDTEGSFKRHAITTKQVITNNGTVPQEDNYEAARKMKETAQFQFSKEILQMISLNFNSGLNPFNEVSNPFITDAWNEIQAGLSGENKNNSDSMDATIFKVQRENEYRVQRKISVPGCSEYEIKSFVKMSENVETNYVVQLGITGKLENEQIGANEIQNILKGMTNMRNKDNFTVIAETTARLVMTYVDSSGIDASATPIPDCQSRFLKFAGSIVNLELLPGESNRTQVLPHVPVAPTRVFINNSTTHQENIYEASREITETASFGFPKGFYQINVMKADEIVKGKLKKSIPFLENVWAQMKSGLIADRSNWNETISYGVQNSKLFQVQQSVVQAGCMRFEVSSFIEMKNDVEINYRVLLEITANLGSQPVRAAEIRENLKNIVFLHEKDEFTSIVETTMKLALNYGHRSGVDAAGTQMLDCLEIQAALVANCKFTCGG